MDSAQAQANNALSCSVLRLHASASHSASAADALLVSFGAGDVRNSANAMCVIPADDAAKEDLEGNEEQRGEEEAKDRPRPAYHRLW